MEGEFCNHVSCDGKGYYEDYITYNANQETSYLILTVELTAEIYRLYCEKAQFYSLSKAMAIANIGLRKVPDDFKGGIEELLLESLRILDISDVLEINRQTSPYKLNESFLS